MATAYDKLIEKLREIFQLDQADLDFGIYRIMNMKREEINRFLEQDLLPQVRREFSELAHLDKREIQSQLDQAIEQAQNLGADPETLPRVKELRQKLESEAVDTVKLEEEVYADLYNFFRRYYDEGDFISLRRYKEGVYAIPYEGEEVKLYWANHDQYYVKTTEHFRDYTFRLPSGKRVHFKLREASTEKDNNKPVNGNNRRFYLAGTDPVSEDNGELVIGFEYRPCEQKCKQADLNAEAVKEVLRADGFTDWRSELSQYAPTDKNPNRTLLEKHLTQYTARNTFDYFIHKDLGGFLRRELDFYIKNEVMHLDDVESESAPRVEQYIAKIKVIRRIAHKVIDFLAQIEGFQKRLWLKKKFVTETNYCITLDRIPEELYSEIAANDAQREEWVRLFAINEIKRDVINPGYCEPLTVEFLKANPYLVLDTALFSAEFMDRLLAHLPDLDGMTDGLVIHGENLQALNLMADKYRSRVNCVYTDPPYNTGGDGFLYKDSYQHSSWVCMLGNRLAAARRLLSDSALVLIHIDNTEQANLRLIGEDVLGVGAFQAMIAWKNKYGPGAATRGIGDLHEHILVFSTTANVSLSAPLDEETVSQYTGRDAKFPVRGGFVTQPLATKSKDPRPNLVYPVTYQGKEIMPDKQWIWCRERMEAAIADDEIVFNEQKDGTFSVRFKQYLRDENGQVRRGKPLSLMLGPFNQDGTDEIERMFGSRAFSFPKPSALGRRLLSITADDWAAETVVLDFFAGSGTAAHAAIDLSREDQAKRGYVLVEMGEYVETVVLPRLKKVVYSKDWENGKPISRQGTSHCLKYIRLESYEDTLNNIEFRRTATQQSLLDDNTQVREDYLLRYMLDAESNGSTSLISIDAFEDPFDYKLLVSTGDAGESRPVNVDLVETFNWLLGLRVKHIDVIRGFRIVRGVNPDGESVLVIWRNTKEKSNDALDEFFQRQGYNTQDMEYDLVYVNGDNNLENLRRPDHTWKVRLIEEEFKRLMFDVEDV